jgi:hypothetical protein
MFTVALIYRSVLTPGFRADCTISTGNELQNAI